MGFMGLLSRNATTAAATGGRTAWWLLGQRNRAAAASFLSNAYFLPTFLLRLAGPIVMLVYPLLEFIRTIEYAEPAAVRQWLSYWVLYSVTSTVEHFLAPVLPWIPLYSLAKLAAFAWLVLPKYHGAATLYDTLIHPFHLRALGRARVRKPKAKRERDVAADVAGAPEGSEEKGVQVGGGMRGWGPDETRVVESLDGPTREAMVEFVSDNGLPAFAALLVEGNKQARRGRSPAPGDDLETRLREKVDLPPTGGRTSSGSKPEPETMSGLSKRRAYNPSSEDTTVQGGTATKEEERGNASSRERGVEPGVDVGA